jgi:23S rRNA pseudouridine2605 synthase
MSDKQPQDGARKPSGAERIAKVIARAGLASRREAEAMVAALRVKVNGRTESNVARTVVPGDAITVDGKPLPQADGARVWLYHKPTGLVVTERDEEGRETVFDALRPHLGRVLSVGRLDLNSEGLLLLTNDGGLKRRLELPATGWLRRYRVRVNGTPSEAAIERLRAGIEVDDDTGRETFAPMQVEMDRQQGANAWLTVGLREGRNREIRRAMAALDLYVNRLIRVSFGPFMLGELQAGAVEEVRPRVLRDQLGGLWEGELAEARRDADAGKDGTARTRGRNPRPSGDRLLDRGRGSKEAAAPKPGRPRGPAGKVPAAGDRPDRPRTAKPPVTRNDGARVGGGAGKPTKAERKAAMRADTSVSLRRGGRPGRGAPKPKPPPKPRRGS